MIIIDQPPALTGDNTKDIAMLYNYIKSLIDELELQTRGGNTPND